MQFGSFGLIGGLTLALASAASAGGFGLMARRASGDPNPKVKGAALLVQADGCHGPGATVTATAEGIVHGRRRSIPLRLTKVATDPAGVVTYAVRRQWPAAGAWVVSLTGVSSRVEGITVHALLELGPNGSLPSAKGARGGDEEYLPLHYVPSGTKEIETTLQAMAGSGKRNTKITRSAR
jgi:hypothetical protein